MPHFYENSAIGRGTEFYKSDGLSTVMLFAEESEADHFIAHHFPPEYSIRDASSKRLSTALGR
ncbi:hypothetical protein IE077_002115 [Cardiosporidium cionae]|uniref:Uncharacterized protein n=1 Tax=Cardiosporidium cionae TaxID=476202 RepID=A0ABQ7JBJ3_9APIC|nr:hypothetical protein IE077_002115 [Cardiosporidium cionae]|eukprot:KAF8821368.1 hypothetical protein IE077_002115 [Cardiosporidium cionae]